MKKVLSTLLVLLLLLGCCTAFIACASNSYEIDASVTVDTSDSIYDENGYLKDSLPPMDFGEATLTILCWNDSNWPEFYEEETADVLRSELFKRDVRVKERINMELKYVSVAGRSNTDKFVRELEYDIASGATDYDVVASYSLTSAVCATSGLLTDLYDTPEGYLDFEKPWWPQTLTDEATIKDKLYFISGDISVNYIYSLYLNYYNRDILNNYASNLEDPLKLAIRGEWTFEKLYQYSACIGHEELGSNDTMGPEDRYGFITNRTLLDGAFFAADLEMFIKDDNGNIIVSPNCFGERAITFVDEFNNFINKSGNAYLDTSADTTDVVGDMFCDGLTFFMFDYAGKAKELYATTKGLNYGILPVPKYSADQESYVTTLGNVFTLYSISAGTAELELAAAYLECAASQSYRAVNPIVFENMMKIRYSPDEESSQVYDIARQTATFDLSRIFHRSLDSKPQWLFRDAIINGTDSWATIGAVNSSSLQNMINKVIMPAFK